MNIRTSENKLIITEEPVYTGYIYIYLLLHYMTGKVSTYMYTRELLDTINIEIPSDGYYVLYRLKVSIKNSDPIYYIDGNVIKYELNIQVKDLIGDYNIELESVSYFFTTKLKNCFKDINENLLNTCSRCGNADPQLTYKRDLLMATLIIIDFLIEDQKFEEAEDILERVGGCNGLCPSNIVKNCGCY